jgi:hypothetical protein
MLVAAAATGAWTVNKAFSETAKRGGLACQGRIRIGYAALPCGSDKPTSRQADNKRTDDSYNSVSSQSNADMFV